MYISPHPFHRVLTAARRNGTGDCSPRQPAVCLTVKKESKNKGKRFYACQERKCEMFVWDDQAKGRERDALLLHNCRSENGVTGSIRPKTPEPAPPLNLSRLSTGPKLTDAKITKWAPKQPKPRQRVFRGLDDPKESYHLRLSDSDEAAEPTSLADKEYPRLSQAQNRQRSYLSQPGQVGDISQTLRDSSYKPPSSGVAVADAGTIPAFKFQSHPHLNGLMDPVTPTAKRKRPVFPGESDDEFGGDDLVDSETERQLAKITDESARKQQSTRGVYETPSAQRTADVNDGIRSDLGLPTPMSRRPGLLVASEERGRSAKRQRRVGFMSSPVRELGDKETQSQPEAVGDPTTPTPYRKTDALVPPAAAAAAAVPSTPSTPAAAAGAGRSPAGAVDDYPKIAEEVLSLLSGQPVSESTKRTLKAAMERHEMRVKGVARGREAARAVVAEREERIAELQARVVSLENGRKMDRARLRELSALGERLMRLSEGE